MNPKLRGVHLGLDQLSLRRLLGNVKSKKAEQAAVSEKKVERVACKNCGRDHGVTLRAQYDPATYEKFYLCEHCMPRHHRRNSRRHPQEA